MADENVLRIGAAVDLGQLQAGTGEAASMVRGMVGQMQEAFAPLKGSIDALTAQLTTMGTAGEGAGVQISHGMKKAEFSMHEAKAAGKLLGEEIGVKMNRHILGFIASLPGVGAAMSAAFNVLAVIGVIELIAHVIEKVKEWREEAKKAKKAWDDQTHGIEDHTDALRLANARIQESIDKLQNKPANHLAVSLWEARVRADELAKSLGLDIDKMKELLEKQNVGFISRILGEAGSSDQKAALESALDGIKKIQDASREAAREAKDSATATKITQEGAAKAFAAYGDAIKYAKEQLDAANQKEREHEQIQERVKNAPPKAAGIIAQGDPGSQAKLIAFLTGALKGLEDQQDLVGVSAANMALTQSQGFVQDAHDANEAEKKLDETRQKGLDHYRKVQAEYEKERKKAHDKERDDKEKEAEEFRNMDESVTAFFKKEEEKRLEDNRKVNEVWIKDDMDRRLAEVNMAKDASDAQAQAGAISEKKHIAQLKKFVKDEYDIEHKALVDKMKLDAADPLVSPEQKAKDYAAILALDRKFHQQQNQLDQQSLKARAKAWQTNLFDPIKQGFSGTIQGMIQGTQTFGQGMANMFNNILASFADMLVNMVLNWIEKWLFMKIFGATTQSESAAGRVMSEAAVAGAAGTASFAAAPWPIDMGAPAFGASMFGAAAAYAPAAASAPFAAKGALVPDDMLMNVHKKEMILPERISSPLQDALANGSFGQRGPTAQAHVTFAVSAIDGASLKRHLSEHGPLYDRMVTKAVEKAIKKGSFRGKF